jgi:hypothetical protein
MDIDISLEHIDTACVALGAQKRILQYQLNGIKNGLVRRGKKECIEEQLTEVEQALEAFEQLLK